MARETEYEQTKIRCPFYRGGSGKRRSIRCEGIGDAQTITQTYGNERQRARQLTVFCQDCYANCEVYRMIVESHGLDE